MKRHTRFFVALIAVALLAAACRQDEPQIRTRATPEAERTFASGTYMAELKSRGKIVIGVKFDVPQFGFLNPATGRPEGFDVDLGRRVARELGVRAEFVEAISANRIPFLTQDKVDLIISTMTINEERRQQIDFSNVYYVAEQRLLVEKGSRIDDVSDLNEQGATVCTAQGSTSEKNIRIVAPRAQVELQQGYAQCFQRLQNDAVQAVTTDDVILVGLRKNDPENYEITGDPFSKEPYGMGVKKGRVGFVDFLNEVLDEVKEDGTWLRLYNKWVRPLTNERGEPPPDEVEAEAPSPSPTGATSP